MHNVRVREKSSKELPRTDDLFVHIGKMRLTIFHHHQQQLMENI